MYSKSLADVSCCVYSTAARRLDWLFRILKINPTCLRTIHHMTSSICGAATVGLDTLDTNESQLFADVFMYVLLRRLGWIFWIFVPKVFEKRSTGDRPINNARR